MRKKYIFGKKLYISILTSILVLLTTVATTFAWVGVFANSTFESFKFDIKASNLREYGIEISATGEEGTFSDTISSQSIKKSILLNWGYTDEQISAVGIDVLFNNLNMEQCTTLPTVLDDKLVSINNFTDIEGNLIKKYYKFDIYVSTIHFYESGNPSDYKLNVFLEKGLISGTRRGSSFRSSFTYPNNFINPLNGISLPENIEPINGGFRITSAFMDSKSVCRVGFEKYEVVEKGKPELYTSFSTPISSIIYTGDQYDYPTYNSAEGTYEFGGILEDDLNLSIGYYNSIEYRYAKAGVKTTSIIDDTADVYGGDIYNIRGVGKTTADKIFSSTTNQLINSENIDEQIGINQMMKVSVYFWIEGWDADCCNLINNAPMTLKINMCLKNEEMF